MKLISDSVLSGHLEISYDDQSPTAQWKSGVPAVISKLILAASAWYTASAKGNRKALRMAENNLKAAIEKMIEEGQQVK